MVLLRNQVQILWCCTGWMHVFAALRTWFRDAVHLIKDSCADDTVRITVTNMGLRHTKLLRHAVEALYPRHPAIICSNNMFTGRLIIHWAINEVEEKIRRCIIPGQTSSEPSWQSTTPSHTWSLFMHLVSNSSIQSLSPSVQFPALGNGTRIETVPWILTQV